MTSWKPVYLLFLAIFFGPKLFCLGQKTDTANYKNFVRSINSEISIIQKTHPDKKITVFPDSVTNRHGVFEDFRIDSTMVVLGKPIYVNIVAFDRLKLFSQGQEVEKLIIKLPEMVVPLTELISKKLSNTISIDSSSGGWQPRGTGLENVAFKKLSALNLHLPEEYFLVKLREFNMNYIGYRSKSQLYLIPIEGDPGKGIPKGKAIKASDVLIKYVLDAKKYPILQ